MKKCLIFILALIVFLSGCLQGEEKVMTVTKYQCYDGSLVKNLNNCPSPSGGAPTTLSTIMGIESTTPTTKPKTTTSCSCGVIKPKVTTTIKLGPACSTDADCGSPSYGAMRCHNGDAYKVRNTPQCVEDDYDGQNHCKTLSELELSRECSDNERCIKEKGCVPDDEE